MSTKIDEGCFVTQRGNRKLGDRVDVDQLEEMVASVTQTSQSTLLLKKKKEMREVDDALEFMKDEYNTRMGNCDQREAEFEQKQMEMRDQVLKFEKFIQENDAKRTRAETKAKQEHRILDQRAQELRKLEKELASAMDEERKLKEQRHRLKRYQEYLLGTVSSSEQDVEEINDLLNRFHTLSEANKDLMKLCEDGDSAYERRRAETQQYRQDKQNEVLVTNSELNERQIELEQIRGGVKRAEHESEQEGERVKGICRESGQVMLAIKNLYSRCKQTMRARLPDMNDKHLDRMQFLERCLYCLNLVRERIEDLGEIESGYWLFLEAVNDDGNNTLALTGAGSNFSALGMGSFSPDVSRAKGPGGSKTTKGSAGARSTVGVRGGGRAVISEDKSAFSLTVR